jgi:hypothetical protein
MRRRYTPPLIDTDLTRHVRLAQRMYATHGNAALHKAQQRMARALALQTMGLMSRTPAMTMTKAAVRLRFWERVATHLHDMGGVA